VKHQFTCMILFAATLLPAQQQPFEHQSLVWEPPPVTEFPASVKPTVRKQMIASLRVSDLPIVLEKTEMAAVQKKPGGSMGSRGDAGSALQWLCFHGVSANGKWVLWLMSGEIDGPSIGGFRWQKVAEGRGFDARCQAFTGDGVVVLPAAIRPGVPEGDVLHAFGQPSWKSSNTLFYLHEHDESIHNQPYTEMNTLKVLVRDGIVWSIEVWKSTTS
jgi:hypothetical protein